MKIVHITTFAGEPHGVMDTNDIVAMSKIKGSPMKGCSVAMVDGEYKVVGNNVDVDCMNGVCDYQPPQGK